jgi:4-amino-4-deoxy-L-arabinose transferase-like glycosyltransferase
MSQPSRTQPARWLLPAIVLIYLILGVLYALYTPDWQAPDEPAHYNYIQYVAEQHRFPVLKPGDYPALYLEEIKAAHFPPEMSITPIRYEFHQPPLYYLLAAPVYRLFGGTLLPLRLLSVAMGAVLLLVISWTVQALAPAHPLLAVGATAFVAFLPMHLTFIASANNDTLAELLLATILLLSIRYLRRSMPSPAAAEDARLLVLLGITTGLGLITKSSVYVALPLVLLAIVARHLWLDEPPPAFSGSLKAVALYLLPAIVLAMPWWLRNIALYGDADFLGLGRHEQVVAGQLRTAEFVATHGFAQLGRDFVLTSFRSFWGQFGWMGVLLDQRLYQALAILSVLALIGFAVWVVQAWHRQAEFQKWYWAAGGLLVLSGLFTLASYVWYNATFVQHQGRYLFPALVPISLAVALGWRKVLGGEHALLLAAGLLAAGVLLRLTGLLSNWPFFMLGATAAGFAVRRLLPRRWDPLVQAAPYLFLVLLAVVSLFLFIVPQLRA